MAFQAQPALVVINMQNQSNSTGKERKGTQDQDHKDTFTLAITSVAPSLTLAEPFACNNAMKIRITSEFVKVHVISQKSI